MTDLLAIVSKAQFEGLAKSARPGDRLRLERYTSTHKSLAPLASGGALFLVTVRPPDERLWLVAVLESPKHEGGAWRSRASDVPVTDVSDLRDRLRFATGTGLQARKGALGMSLQTPRQLTEADAALLRAAALDSVPAPAPSREPKPRAARAAIPKGPPEAPKPEPAAPLPPPEPYVAESPRPMTGEAARLWRRILEDPDDLKTRSVLADLLQERGDPLGEYLQLACLLDEMPEDDSRHAGLRDRAEALRRRHLVAWTHEVAAIPQLRPQRQPHRKAFVLGRGLVEGLACTTRSVPGLAAAAKVAPIRRLEVDPFGESVKAQGWAEALAGMPELGRIRELELKVESEEEALAVLRSPHLARLERLSLSGMASAEALLAEIVSSKACADLRELRLAAGAAPRGKGRVARLSALPLRTLSLSRTGVGPEAAQALSKMKTLRSLSLRDEPLGLAGARALASSAELAGLEALSLEGCDVPEAGLKAIAAAPALGAVERLALGPVNAKALAAMLEGWTLPRLRELTVSGALREDGATRLARSKALSRLEALALHDAFLGDDGARALSRREAPGLRRVDLSSNGIGPQGMAALASGPLLAGVRELDLAHNKCRGEGGKALAAGPWLAGLEKLRLFYNWMGVQGLRAILLAMPGAEVLDLGENNYGSEVLRVAAAGALPRLHTLKLGQEADPALLQKWLESGHAMRLRSLGVHHVHVGAPVAGLLAPIPELEDLYFSFCTFEPEALTALEQRFPGLTRFWPYRD